MAHDPAPGPRLLALWRRLGPLPGGSWIFSFLLGRMVPYSGTLGARVRTLEPGRAAVRLRDRRKVRNHLGSVHAIALANLGELATGLSLLVGLQPSIRGILVGLEVDYRKKARGTLEAAATCTPPVVRGRTEHTVTARIADESGDVVAVVTARWLLAPRDVPGS